MGWLYYYREPGQSDLDHFREKFQTSANPRYLLIDGATKNFVFYGAVADTETGEVEGFVAMLNRCRGEFNFGYKDMTERSGPCDAECPDRILDLLTPLPECDHGEEVRYCGVCAARDWRAASREFNAKAKARPKVRRGDTIRFAEPIEFMDGTERRTFTLLDGRRNRWRAEDGAIVRLNRRCREREHEKIAA
jgi:hypothetical protein